MEECQAIKITCTEKGIIVDHAPKRASIAPEIFHHLPKGCSATLIIDGENAHVVYEIDGYELGHLTATRKGMMV